ncbi:MAG: prepilin peptidase [Plesiomonas shigelloides]
MTDSLDYPLDGTLLIAFAALFGLLIGSFLNVVIYRYPLMLERRWHLECAEQFPELTPPADAPRFNLILPGSHCPHCQHPVRWFDNLPVLSWLVLRGHCRHCQAPISKRYPAIELLTALVFALPVALWGLQIWSVACALFGAVLITASMIDLDRMWLPDSLTQPLLWAGLLLAWGGYSPLSLHDAVLGAAVGYLSLWSLFWMFKLLTGKEGMGRGDFVLMAALCAWSGPTQLLLIALLASVCGLVYAVIARKTQQAIPFGPWLALGGWISLLFSDTIYAHYFALMGY